MFGIASRTRKIRRVTPMLRLSRGFLAALPAPVFLTVPTPGFGPRSFDFTPKRLGLGNLGALNGGITTTPGGFGTLGAAWELDGSTGYLSVPHSADFNLSKITVIWAGSVTNISAGTQQRLIAKWDGSATWILECNNQNWTFWCNNGTSTLSAQSAASTGFHVVVGTYDGVNIKLYVDGVPTATTALAGNLSTNSHAIYLGTNEIASAHWMAGYTLLGEIFGSAITAAQVSDLYNCLRAGEPFPLFQPQVSDLAFGSAAAPTGGLLLRRRRMAA